MRGLRRTFLTFGLFLLAATLNTAATQTAPPLYIIFDGSNSMWGELPDASRKIEVAKQVFNNLDPALFTDREVALRLYGHRRASDCADIELAVPFGPADENVARMAERVDGVTPRGKTPITRSLQAALDDFNQHGSPAGDILLISDGIETCDADPCDLVQAWKDSGVNIRVHVVGLGLTDVARGALQCIADASGTEYHDANSAEALGAAIEATATSEPPPPGEPDPQPQRPRAEFRLVGQDADGNFVPVQGTLTRAGEDPQAVSNNGRFVFDAGTYTLQAGVPTLNGVIYEPITQEVEVLAEGTTRVVVTVPRPPRVITRFVENGEEIRGVLSHAYQDGNEVFSLRPYEEHFVLPGTYDFEATLNQDNELSITETIVAGEDKTLLFEAVQTVRLHIVVRPQGHDAPLRQHQELMQNGEAVYRLHYANGGPVRPGVYTVQSDHALTPYVIENVEVTTEDPQTIELTVPFGLVRARYVFRGEAPTTDLRCWFGYENEEGRRISSRALQCDGRDIIVREGTYYVRVWDRLGNFVNTPFEVVTGQTTEVTVQEQ